jgi:hypothetical protein
MLASLLASLLCWQTPEATPAKPDTPAVAVAAPAVVETWDDKTAKAALAEFAAATKGTPSMAQKNQALEKLATGSHPQLLKPLVDIVEKDKSVVLRKRAAQLLANQPPKEANTTIRKLLKNTRIASYPQINAELIRGLARCGYDGKQWKEIADLFEQDYNPECVPLHEALLDLIIAHKERQAIPLLLRNIDEPASKDPDAADNPPQEYWEARWKSWSAWKGKVKDALFAITGQRFSTAAEAEAWLKNNPK